MVRMYNVTNKESGLKYKLRVSPSADMAYVTDGGDIIWSTDRNADETFTEFIIRAMGMLRNDEDM